MDIRWLLLGWLLIGGCCMLDVISGAQVLFACILWVIMMCLLEIQAELIKISEGKGVSDEEW